MIEAYPLYWPEDRKRTHPTLRCKSAFSGSFADIRKGVCDELDRMGATNVIISSNIPLRSWRDVRFRLTVRRQAEEDGNGRLRTCT